MAMWDISYESAWALAMKCDKSRHFLFDNRVVPLAVALAMSPHPPVLSGFSFLPARLTVKRTPPLELGHLMCSAYQDPSLLLCNVFCLNDKYKLIPMAYAITRHPSFRDSRIAAHKVAIFADPANPAVFLRVDFTWLASGVLSVCVIVHPSANAQRYQGAFPSVAKIITRVYPIEAARALRFGYQFLDSALLDGTSRLLHPETGCVAIDAYDSRHQSACIFCFSRKLTHCDCPVLFRRRAVAAAAQPRPPPAAPPAGVDGKVSWEQVSRSIQKNVPSGTMASNWRFVTTSAAGAVDTRVLAGYLSSYRFFYTAGSYMRTLVQRLFNRAGQSLGVPQANNLSCGYQNPSFANHARSDDQVSIHPQFLVHSSQGQSGYQGQVLADYNGADNEAVVQSELVALRETRTDYVGPAHLLTSASPGARKPSSTTQLSVVPPHYSHSGRGAIRAIPSIGKRPRPAGTIERRAPATSAIHASAGPLRPQIDKGDSDECEITPVLLPEPTAVTTPNNGQGVMDDPSSQPGTPEARSRSPSPPRHPTSPSERGVAIGPGLWRCLECGIEIKGRRANLTRHIQNRHDMVRDFECPVVECKKRFQSKVNLDRHFAGVHEGRPLKCPKCPRDFKTEAGLSEHNRIAHEKSRTLACKTCGKCYGRRSSLRRHAKVHENEANP